MSPARPVPRVPADNVARVAGDDCEDYTRLSHDLALDLLDARERIAELEARLGVANRDPDHVPPGWRLNGYGDAWIFYAPGGRPIDVVSAVLDSAPHRWIIRPAGDMFTAGEAEEEGATPYPYALDAMRAADLARGVT